MNYPLNIIIAVTTIHFICRGNVHRSYMAEAYLRSLKLSDVTVLSSGCTADEHRQANERHLPYIRRVLAGHGVGRFAKAQPEQLTQARINAGDITVCMNQRVADACRARFVMPADTLVWDVDDINEGEYRVEPGGDRTPYTEEIYLRIVRRINELVRNLHLAHSSHARALLDWGVEEAIRARDVLCASRAS